MAIKTKNILVTGSAGFLGSPLCFNLLKMGYKVTGIDNYSNSDESNTQKLIECYKNSFNFYDLDLSDNISDLNEIFIKHRPSFVIHFAALKSVDESEKHPEVYWRNNIQSTKNLLSSMINFKCNKIIYSSSAAVYGNQDVQPIRENALLEPISVYAETKIKCEELIKEASISFGIDGISLRYFNPIGSHSSKLFKEVLKNNSGTIMNEIINTALDNNRILKIFGNNYPTKDGTCERDFIHLDDLINAHEKSINFINDFRGYEVFNVGTGKPVSILELVSNFIKHNQVGLRYEFSLKRAGDIQSSYADVRKINDMLNWESKKNLEDMVKDSWEAHSKKND
jgi:UDP-glucose 4-epimerase